MEVSHRSREPGIEEKQNISAEMSNIIREYLHELDEKVINIIQQTPKNHKKCHFQSMSTVATPQTIRTMNSIIPREPLQTTNLINKKYIVFCGQSLQVKEIFLGLCSKRNMNQIVKNQKENLIVKKSCFSIKCLFRVCFSAVEEGTVYELATSENRARLILISGEEQQFTIFKKQYYFQLWRNGFLNIPLSDIISLSLCRYSAEIVAIKNAYKQSLKQFKTLPSQDIDFQLEDLMQRTRETQLLICRNIQEEGLINISSEKLIHTELFAQLCLSKYYREMLRSQTHLIEQKKQKLKSTNSIIDAFTYLEAEIEVEEVGEVVHESIVSIVGEYPFKPAVVVLDELGLEQSPMHLLEKVGAFTRKLRQECFLYHKKIEKIFNMDEQLPILIFCALMSRNKDLKCVFLLLLHWLEKDDNHEGEKRILAALNASLNFIESEWK